MTGSTVKTLPDGNVQLTWYPNLQQADQSDAVRVIMTPDQAAWAGAQLAYEGLKRKRGT